MNMLSTTYEKITCSGSVTEISVLKQLNSWKTVKTFLTLNLWMNLTAYHQKDKQQKEDQKIISGHIEISFPNQRMSSKKGQQLAWKRGGNIYQAYFL